MGRSSKPVIISRPFDARHVAGVGIPGTTNPLGVQRAFTASETDTTDTTTDGKKMEAKPKRSNTIASSFARPSLRLKTSLSRLARSASNPPDANTAQRRRERESSRPARVEEDARGDGERQVQRDHRPSTSRGPRAAASDERHPQHQSQRESSRGRQSSRPSHSSLNSHPLPPPSRPKRADSGTAIDFSDVPEGARPLGFREIIAVRSFKDRMMLYKRTREYWAYADHGLEEWVGRASARV
ncbi:hypothetical protein BCR34DRAFT_584693 [Clohesyomyces aquaticus]|uniref:Uncharacterized protein n=1 Tax=Clohesyomyces aquaticus TaxID=1231657 RepID=A0A1Y2A0Q8_9PLEO|nr:hypothetical protein BCR34DRAFT_584693 [Clohesyomyces aquaticus]